MLLYAVSNGGNKGESSATGGGQGRGRGRGLEMLSFSFAFAFFLALCSDQCTTLSPHAGQQQYNTVTRGWEREEKQTRVVKKTLTDRLFQ